VAVEAVETGGLVFVAQDTVPVGEVDVPELLGAEQELFDSAERLVNANWKILAECFLEGYHIKATHKDTFFPLGYDNLTVTETFGRHSRVTFPFRRIEAQREVPPGQRRLDGAVTSVHHLFPNAMLAHLTHHSMFVVLEPLSTTSTRFLTYRLTKGPATAEALVAAKRDAEFIEIGLGEDREMARAVQRGLESGANTTVEFGRFEGAIVHFHSQLTQLLDDAARPAI